MNNWWAGACVGILAMLTCRIDRDLQRGRRAAARVRADGATAFAAACAHIEATFSPAMHHSTFKDRVATLMKGGIAHPEAWGRYRRLVERHPITNLQAAIVLVERMRRVELEAHAASVRSWGHCSRPRLALMVLDEVRLILRMLRRYAPARFPALMAEVQAADPATPFWTSVTVEAAE
jgi:hypothetical protein